MENNSTTLIRDFFLHIKYTKICSIFHNQASKHTRTSCFSILMFWLNQFYYRLLSYFAPLEGAFLCIWGGFIVSQENRGVLITILQVQEPCEERREVLIFTYTLPINCCIIAALPVFNSGGVLIKDFEHIHHSYLFVD